MSKIDEKAEMSDPQGVWKPVSVTVSGEKLEGRLAEIASGATLIIEGDKAILKKGDTTISVYEMAFDASRDPKTYDGKVVEGFEVGSTITGIWKVEEDILVWCGGKKRPTRFESQPGVIVTIHKRQDPSTLANPVRQRAVSGEL